MSKPIATMPDLGAAKITKQTHVVDLPQMCPVSGNPQPGSYIEIEYTPAGCFLEVYGLAEYVASYIGGHPSGIRDMEQTIQQTAADCAGALGVPVTVRAYLVLDCGRLMRGEGGEANLKRG